MNIVELYQTLRFLKLYGGYSELDLMEMYPFEMEIYYFMVSAELKKKEEL